MPSPRIIQAFTDAGCFTLDEALDVTGTNPKKTWAEVKYLLDSGYVDRVRRGLYVLDPDRVPAADPDRFVVASKVADPYLISYHSALELHGVAASLFFRDLHITCERRFTPFEWEGTRFQPVLTGPDILEVGAITAKRNGIELRLASRELCLIQGADRPDLVGGLEELQRSIDGFPYLDWGALIALLELHSKTILYRKVGYLIAANADRWRPPEAVIDLLRSRLGKGMTYFDARPNSDNHKEHEWQVFVPNDAASGRLNDS